jgi:hypothetical protein
MALNLVDKLMGGTFKQQQPPPAAPDGSSERKQAESGSFSGGGNPFIPSRCLNSMDNQPGFSRGGFRARGGKSGFNDSRGGRRSSDSSGLSGDKRYYKSGDRSLGGASGGRSGSGGSGYSSRY